MQRSRSTGPWGPFGQLPREASRSRDRSPGGWGHRAAAGSRSSDRPPGALQAAGGIIVDARFVHLGVFIHGVEAAVFDHREHQIRADNLVSVLRDHAAQGAYLANEALSIAAASRAHIATTEEELLDLRNFVRQHGPYRRQ